MNPLHRFQREDPKTWNPRKQRSSEPVGTVAQMADDILQPTNTLKSESSDLTIKQPARGMGHQNVFRHLWEQWKRIARRIGDFQARVLLILFYFVILAPFALVVRWATDPLAIKPGTLKGWRNRSEERGTLQERATRQS